VGLQLFHLLLCVDEVNIQPVDHSLRALTRTHNTFQPKCLVNRTAH
jgi:hypothetical protein